MHGRPSAGSGRLRALRLAALLVLLAPLLAAPAAAAPAGPDQVRASLSVVLETPSRGRFDGNFSFSSYTLNGTWAAADDIRLALAGPYGPGLRAGLEWTARSMFLAHFAGLFPGDNLSSVESLLDNSSIEDPPGTDRFSPPIVVRAAGSMLIDPRSFGLPATADLEALAPLVLADGAELHRDLSLTAPPGHAIELAVTAFPGSVFNETGNTTILFPVDNTAGVAPLGQSLSATMRSAMAPPAGGNLLRVSGTVDIPDLSTVRISGSVEFRRADPSGYWEPPHGLRNLTSVSGATLSELVRSGALSEQALYEYGVLPVQADLQSRLASLLNLTLAFTPAWNTTGNLTCTVSALSANRSLFGLSPALVRGALKAGATYSFNVQVDIGWPTTLDFIMPAGMKLDGLATAGSQSGRLRSTWSSLSGRGNVSACLMSSDAPAYSGDDVSVRVVADFSAPLLDTRKLLFEGSAEVPVKVDVRVRMGVVSVPASISAFLPENLTLRYMTADILRLLLSERVITSAEMDGLLKEVRPRLDSAMRAALGQSVLPNIRYVTETLEGYDLNSMDGSRPVEIHAWAPGQRTKDIDLFKTVRASPGLASISQDFSFKGVIGWNVTYRMRFAPETKLVSLGQSGARASRGSDGGRDYFEVAFGPQGGSSNVTAVLEPSAGLIFSALGPVCVPALVLLAVAAALVLRRLLRRRRLRRVAVRVSWDEPAK